MVARISNVRINPDDIPTGVQFLKEDLLPHSEQQEGFRSVIAFTRADGHVYVVEFYDSEDQLRATEIAGWYQRMQEIFGEKGEVRGQVRRNFYEVHVAKTLEANA